MQSAHKVIILGLFLVASSLPAAQDDSTVTIVRPGAPGQNSTILTPGQITPKVRPPSKDDIAFMQGMVMHHSQAVEMTALLRTHSHNKALLNLGKRISISQTDEIQSMKQWLIDRGKPTTMDMSGMTHTPGMAMMPGMLTAQQMQALAKANGPRFDYLFLTGMIQHHTGALTMVQDLFKSPDAGQDPVLFDFATDVDNTQRAEIDIMQTMLEKKK
jgi:uncharacterized protein (DUF305 family)